MKIARSFSSPDMCFLRVWDDIRWRSATTEQLQEKISGIKRNRIMTIMKVLELPILYTMIFAKHASIKLDPGILELKRLWQDAGYEDLQFEGLRKETGS